MKFEVGQEVVLTRSMFKGQLPEGSRGTIREARGLITYMVKFRQFTKLVRVYEEDLARAR